MNEPPRHIVAVGGLVTRADGRVLLLRGPRRGWEFPGGQVEEGESLTAALCREIREETGVEVSVGSLVGVYTNVQSKIVMFGFQCDWLSGEARTCEEALEVAWVTPTEALEQVQHPALLGRLRDKLAFNGRVVYRSYSVDATQANFPGEIMYTVHEERFV